MRSSIVSPVSGARCLGLVQQSDEHRRGLSASKLEHERRGVNKMRMIRQVSMRIGFTDEVLKVRRVDRVCRHRIRHAEDRQSTMTFERSGIVAELVK